MKLICAGFLILYSFSVFAQAPSDGGILSRWLDARPLQGMKFKIQAAVRVEALSPSAEATLWVRVDRSDREMVYYDNMRQNPIRGREWTVYTTREGRVDKNARGILFGGTCKHKGIFYFDDFHFYVQKKDDAPWEEIQLPDNGFESDTSVLNKTWFTRNPGSAFVWSLSEDVVWQGKKSFRADGSRAPGTFDYGSNDSTGKFATANGIRIYYEEYGHGAPLLLLHGNRGSIADFGKQIPVLSQQFHVIAVDTRGQGYSLEDGKTYTYDLFAEDMNALLDKLHLDSVNVLGWSDGGNTGLIMAMKYPEKVRRLAVMGANIFIDGTVADKSIFRLLRQQKKEIEGDSSHHALEEMRFIHMLETEPRHRFEELQTIHCPVLVMAGEKDAIKEGHTRQIAAHIPGSQLLIFPKGTHDFPADHPAEFNKAVTDFFIHGKPGGDAGK